MCLGSLKVCDRGIVDCRKRCQGYRTCAPQNEVLGNPPPSERSQGSKKTYLSLWCKLNCVDQQSKSANENARPKTWWYRQVCVWRTRVPWYTVHWYRQVCVWHTIVPWYTVHWYIGALYIGTGRCVSDTPCQGRCGRRLRRAVGTSQRVFQWNVASCSCPRPCHFFVDTCILCHCP